MTPKQREIQRKRRLIEYAEQIGNVRKACRYYGVARSTFYLWRARYREFGDKGLMHRRCVAHNHPNKTPAEVVEKILHLRRTYHMGPLRSVWYLERYHDLKTSDATVYRVCRRHVEFLTLQRKKGAPIRRYQYTAIDDATRVQALKVYRRHTQANAIDFINYVVEKFPFRIRTIRTDRGHEFQALFHWHVTDLGMEHVYIKPGTPQLNGKVERSHRTDKDELYQLLTYRDDVNLEKKLAEWERCEP
jgi:transposase InsO family protein